MSGDSNNTGPHHDDVTPSDDARGARRLPPPAFPPGSRRVSIRRANARGEDLSDAFISPDDPIPERSGGVDEAAFISPDDPIPHRAPRMAAVAEEADDGDFDPDDVVVTGMGDDAHMTPEELAHSADPFVWELVHQVGKLAEALKQKGEAGLRSSPDMSRFEATLRAYCVGYLAGRRAEEEGD